MNKADDVPAGVMCWHLHHDRLCEVLIEPKSARTEFIELNKPANEIRIRLERFQPVQGVLPTEVIQAAKAYGQAWKVCREAYRAYGEAGNRYSDWKIYDEACRACAKFRRACDESVERNLPAIERLHAAECLNCPWDGQTLFPAKGGAA